MRKFLSVIICMFCIITTAFAGSNDVDKLVDCAKNGDLNCVRGLISANNVDIDARDNKGYTALIEAAMYGHLDIVKYLIEHDANIEASNSYDDTALILAAYNGNLDVVKYLIEHGADVNARDNDGDTALILAADNGYLDVVKYLIEHGANVNARDNDGDTALIGAAYNGYLDVVKYLIEHGANVNAKGNDGKTALMFAVEKDYQNIARYLIEHGADVNARDNDGQTVWDDLSDDVKQYLKIKGTIADIQTINKSFGRSRWKTADGNFNGARLLSDSVAGVVLGTAGGLITSSIIKKNQTKHGFENLKCTINGQFVSDYGDEFTVGVQD